MILRFDSRFDSNQRDFKIRFDIRFDTLMILRFDSIFDSTFFYFKIRFEDSVESSNLTNLKIRESYDSTISENFPNFKRFKSTSNFNEKMGWVYFFPAFLGHII